jgi:hypothetical protein
MNEFDTLVFDQLDAFTPAPQRQPHWQDVLGRAHKSRVRRLVVALAAAVAILGSAAAVAAALGGFDKWLVGEPGRPAPKAEQERFQRANEHSVAAFPKDTKLRELIRTEVGGTQYVLYGFRSGSSLCLRLNARALRRRIGPACAPVSKIVHSPAPLLVVVGNSGWQNQHGRTDTALSFGLVADGISRVDVHAVDGRHDAILGGNAYLWIQQQPNSGQRVLTLTAVRRNGSRITVPVGSFNQFPVDASPERPPRGPARVQARIPHPTVGWFVRGERRGVSLKPGDPQSRWIKPDPESNVLVGLSGQWCLMLFKNVGQNTVSCSDGDEFWARGPLNEVLTGEGDEFFVRVSGVAADGVRGVVVYLADGERQRAALRSNIFTTLVSKDEFPIRVVAYNARDRVVAVHTWRWNLGITVPVRARRELRETVRVTGPHGVTAVARVGPRVNGYRCWRVDFSTGQSPAGCLPRIGNTGPDIWVDVVQPAGRDLFVIGHARGPVARVQLEFRNGDVLRTRPVAGLFVFAIPRGQLRRERQVAFAVGYDGDGRRFDRQGVVFRTRR